MFNNNTDDQQNTHTDIDQVAKDIDENPSTPHFGLGSNPSTFTPVMPTQAQSAPPINDDGMGDEPAPDGPVVQGHEDNNPAPAPLTPVSQALPGDLEGIKNQALQQLSPLVGKLDQNPEDKFRTLMMLIQASDNHELIKEAYEAANKIQDETAKAQALLSVVNEINYFSQQQQQ